MEEMASKVAFDALIEGAKRLWGWVSSKKEPPIEEIKRAIQILFVDDEEIDSYPIPSLRQAGWNVRQIKDIQNLDAEEIRQADIIFMDYKGVGAHLAPKEEGIGLMKVLRNKYPNKHIIFYSGYAGFIPGHDVHGLADGWIQKSADPFVYLEQIEAAALSIYARR